MRPARTGALATAMTLILTAAASAQSGTTYYQPAQNTYATGTAQPSLGSVLSTQSGTLSTAGSYAAPTATTTPYLAPQTVGPTYATSAGAAQAPSTATSFTSTAAPTQTYAAPVTTTAAPSTYASPYVPTQSQGFATAPTLPAASTYVAPQYGTASTTYVQPAQTFGGVQSFGTATTSYQPLPSPSFPATAYGVPIESQPLPAPSGYTPAVPASTVSTDAIEDTDSWTYNLARFYPAIQACLRRSTAKNPVIANIQEQGDKTRMLIGEGGSSSYSTCSTGLTGTTVKANSDVRTTPPAFFAPLGSTFTLSPERPFQPIVDTDQKVIGWMVRTRPSAAYDQFGQAAPGFDGQFIPPVMVNTSVGKS